MAAATVVAGAGILGVGVAGPAISGASAVQVSYDVAPTAFPTFAESLQTLLDAMGVGSIQDLLGALNSSLSLDSTFTDFMNTLFPNQPTLSDMFGVFGMPIDIPLYSSSGDSLLGGFAGEAANSPFIFNQPASFFAMPAGPLGIQLLGYGAGAVNGVHLGDIGLGRLVDLLLGGANEGDSHSLLNLTNQLNIDLSDKVPTSMLAGFGWLLPLVGLASNPTYQQLIDFAGSKLDNMNQVQMGVGPFGNHTDHFALPLSSSSSINDWLSALLGVPTDPVRLWSVPVFSAIGTSPSTWLPTGSPTVSLEGDQAMTLGGYLQSVLFGGSTETLASQSLADLFGVNPNETWIQFLAEQGLGGSFFHPSGETLGGETIGALLGQFLPDLAPILDGSTPVTDLLEALGLLNW